LGASWSDGDYPDAFSLCDASLSVKKAGVLTMYIRSLKSCHAQASAIVLTRSIFPLRYNIAGEGRGQFAY
jgi:hypothetical protein